MIRSFLFIYLTFISMPAYAYLDPGFASIVIQSVVAFFAAIFAIASISWFKIKLFFSKLNNKFNKKNKYEKNKKD